MKHQIGTSPREQKTNPTYWSRKIAQIMASLLALGVVSTTSACAGTNVAPVESNNAADFQACLLTYGPAPLGSDNARAIEGLRTAQKLLGISIHEKTVTDPEKIQNAVDQEISANCNLVIGIGEEFSNPIVQKSKIYRDRDFALLVAPGTDTKGTRDNIQVVGFELTQPAFLAGYIAAGTSSTGKVAVLADRNTPSRRAIVSAYVQGVQRYNQAHKTDRSLKPVQVNAKIDGSGIYLGEKVTPQQLITTTQKIVKTQADVIFLAIDADGNPALRVLAACNRIAKEKQPTRADQNLCPEGAKQLQKPNLTGGTENQLSNLDQQTNTSASPLSPVKADALLDYTAIWYRNDGVVSQKAKFKKVTPPILTSVVMDIKEAMIWTIRDARNHRFYLNSTQVVGNYANHGVLVSPFYDYDASVPNKVKNEVQQLIEHFRAGSLAIRLPDGSYPPGQNPEE